MLREFNTLVGKVDSIMEVSGDLSLVEKEYPHLPMIRRRNLYLLGVFEMVKDRLDEMIQAEMARRRQLAAETQKQ
jgi:hypothetical protein